MPMDAEARERYVQELIRECKANFTSIDTIYFGGGTPSLLEIEQIERILEEVRRNYTIDTGSEITIEVNPATLGETDEQILDKLKSYRRMGINRLSMGVQSMSDDVLKYLGRIHNAGDVRRDYKLAREAGFDNINLDLILSVPYGKDPMAQAVSDVKSLIGMNPEHISCYSLQLEEDTPFYNMYQRGELQELDDELDRKIYHKVCDILKEAGYEHYEISNFAKPGKESRHNSKYWDMSEYVALGLGASGFVGGVRYQNTSDMDKYLAGEYLADEHQNTERDNISEAVFLGLRRNRGIRYDEVFCEDKDAEQEFWDYYADVRMDAEDFVKSGHLIIDNEGMHLTEKGIDISNKIMALFV